MANFKEELKSKLLTKNPFKSIIGQEDTKKELISALLMERHVLILGEPGIGKTTLAKSVADVLPKITENGKEISGEHRFVRVQGSPDLTVEDLLGDIDPIKALKFGPQSSEAFTPGKIFKANKGILFFDELNRCPEKLQNALLQVLQEGYSTIGGYDIDFPTDFIFIATMNPEDSSTEKVSDVLLDRFDVIYMKYPETQAFEVEIVEKYSHKYVEVPKRVTEFIVKFVRTLRNDVRLDKKPSVRASIGLYERAQSFAKLKNKNVTSLDDVKDSMVSVLAHRIGLKASLKYHLNPGDLLKSAFDEFFSTEANDEDLVDCP